MALPPYSKPHAAPAAWVTHLQARGLLVPNPAQAAREIELVGYERLRIYFIARRQTHQPHKPFRPNTHYRDILQIYACDREIRSVCFEACGDFEIAFRNSMSEALSAAFGSHPHKAVDAFKSTKDRQAALMMLSATYAKSKDARADHYRAKYGDPVLPPFWTMKEFLTFGAAARFYGLLSNPMKTVIAASFGVPTPEVFSNWLECLVDLRNICAHHDRLFNRAFQKQPRTLRRTGVPTAPVNKLRALLECLDHMLASRGLTAQAVATVGAILPRYPEVLPAEAGY